MTKSYHDRNELNEFTKRHEANRVSSLMGASEPNSISTIFRRWVIDDDQILFAL
jgi:hypothetical protein